MLYFNRVVAVGSAERINVGTFIFIYIPLLLYTRVLSSPTNHECYYSIIKKYMYYFYFIQSFNKKNVLFENNKYPVRSFIKNFVENAMKTEWRL